jgi:hypothetical protein
MLVRHAGDCTSLLLGSPNYLFYTTEYIHAPDSVNHFRLLDTVYSRRAQCAGKLVLS